METFECRCRCISMMNSGMAVLVRAYSDFAMSFQRRCLHAPDAQMVLRLLVTVHTM